MISPTGLTAMAREFPDRVIDTGIAEQHAVTLAAGMAHEIRNPLSSIKTFVQLLPRKIEQSGFLDKFERTVPRELNRINALVEDLLDLARVPKYVFQSTHLKTLLEQTLDATDAQLQAGKIECRCMVADDVPSVRADANQLIRAFHNLIRNANQAMGKGGSLLIKTDFVDGDISVSFKDTGSGISAENMGNIFEPFHTTRKSGTGLGLLIVRRIAREHGGEIELESEEGKGTKVTMFLPLAPRGVRFLEAGSNSDGSEIPEPTHRSAETIIDLE